MIECRYRAAGNEVRVKETDHGKTIVGYAAVYYNEKVPGTMYRLFPGLTERIAPGAFDRVIDENQDVRGLFNHSVDFPLGRTASGTMRLNADKIGLRYEIDVPDTQTAADVVESIKRGDITGSSFSFTVREERFIDPDENEGGDTIRELADVDVFDVGPVTFPAYEATTANARGVTRWAPAPDSQDVERLRGVVESRKARREAALAREARVAALESDNADLL